MAGARSSVGSWQVVPLLAMILLLTLTGCSEESSVPVATVAKQKSPQSVAVTNVVSHSFAVAAFPEDWTIELIDQESMGPSWQPSRADIEKLQRASIIIWHFPGYETWRQRVSLSRQVIQEESAGFGDDLLTAPDTISHRHGPKGEKPSVRAIWGTWLDPELARRQLDNVERIATEAAAMDAASSAVIELQRQLEQLDDRVVELRTRSSGLVVLSETPQLGYLTNRLGWKIVGSVPNDSEPAAAVIRDSGADLVLFVDNGQIESSGDRFGTIPAVCIDMCETFLQDAPSIIERMNTNLDRIADAVELLPGR